MAKVIKYSEGELTIITMYAEQCVGNIIHKNILDKLFRDIMEENGGSVHRTFNGVTFKLREVLKKMGHKSNYHKRKQIIPARIVEETKPINPNDFCFYVKGIKESFLFLKEENERLKKEKQELVTQLRDLRMIRQAVEQYQHKFN